MEKGKKFTEGKAVGDVVEFSNMNQLRKKSVRGLLRKRAKKYESESDSDGEVNEEKGDDNKHRTKKLVLKKTFASAFTSIINRNVEDDEKSGPILSKYKKPAKEVSAEYQKEKEQRLKKLEKEKLRLMGRHIPTAEDEEKERELQIVATRGVVQLFNTVTEFQVNVQKEAAQAQKDTKSKTAKIIQQVGSDKITANMIGSNERIIKAIQSKQSKWKVLEDDSEDEDGNLKIEEY